MPLGFTDLVSTGLPCKQSRGPAAREGGGRHETPDEGQGGAGRENPDLCQDRGQCRRGQGHRMLLSTGDPPPTSPSPSHASPGTRLSSLLVLVGCLSAAQRCTTGGHRQRRASPTARYGGGRGDLCSCGHRGDLAVTLIADKIVLQIHAQPLASPSGCLVQGKGVLGEVAAPRGTHPRRTHPKVLWPNPFGDLPARSGYPPPHGPWPQANPLPLARQHPLPLPLSTGLAKAPTLCWHRILQLNPAA